MRELARVCVGLSLLLGCAQHGDPAADAEQREVIEAPPAQPEPATTRDEPAGDEQPQESVAVPFTPLSCKPITGALGRLDGDAVPDLAILCHGSPSSDARLIAALGAAEGRFVGRPPVSVSATGLVLADLDDDGNDDVLLLDGSRAPHVRVGLGDGRGGFALLDELRVPGRYGGELHGAALGDLDGDGHLDAVVPLWDELRVLPGSGDGRFARGYALTVGRDPYDVAIGDLDGDGDRDIVATSQAAPARDPDHYDASGAGVWIYLGQTRRFAKAPVRIDVSGAKQVELGDFDGDGRLDIGVSGAGGLTLIRNPLDDAPELRRELIGTDGTLLAADVRGSPAPELLTSSYIQGRVHVVGPHELTGSGFVRESIEAGDYAVGLFAADARTVVVLDAGSPDGAYGLGPGIEVLALR